LPVITGLVDIIDPSQQFASIVDVAEKISFTHKAGKNPEVRNAQIKMVFMKTPFRLSRNPALISLKV